MDPPILSVAFQKPFYGLEIGSQDKSIVYEKPRNKFLLFIKLPEKYNLSERVSPLVHLFTYSSEIGSQDKSIVYENIPK